MTQFNFREHFDWGFYCRWIGWHYFACLHLCYQHQTLSLVVFGWEFGYGWHESAARRHKNAEELERMWSDVIRRN